jgi:uncharacterized damage-inducible protein DinB
VDDIWRDALLYNRWANLKILDDCSPLTEEQLQLKAAGAYGSIADMLVHTLSAEQRYVRRLTGAEATLNEKHDFPGVEKLKEHAARSGDALVKAAEALRSDDTTVADYDGTKVKLKQSLIVVQAIHHGNDHRTQIGMILESNSIPHENIDVWHYGLSVQC